MKNNKNNLKYKKRAKRQDLSAIQLNKNIFKWHMKTR
jgi:hypothetical protein